MTAVNVLVALIFVTAVGWTLRQVSRAPHDRPLRAVTLCLVSAAVAYPIGLPKGQAVIDGAVGVGAAKLAQNILLLCTVYWLMCFYLYSAADSRRGQRRARWEALPLLTTAVVITVATVLTPPGVRDRTYATADMRVPELAVFYLTAGLYLVYALAMALRWTWRYARSSRRPHSVGLRLAALAMAGMVLAGSARAVFVVVRWRGGTVPPELLVAASLAVTVAVPLFLVGVTYPGVATRIVAGRVWWQHRRTYQRLYPLWALLHEAFPQDALSRVPSSRWRDALRLRGVHRGYYRRLIECRDGLVHISPYLAEASAPGEAAQLAAHLRAALRRYQAGEPAPAGAVPVAVPAEDGIDADAEQLVALSEALRQG
ncbi:hypothetical protein HC031_19630 [Planosporangium thailandense]|uniref:DUF6545 domain-containing protein n=1 Tax=Planosporangium thailandense TaxID=765197 RepID=A0ABX0Y0N6_9ACTN|nr:MAB_1171c family putative transporter [Planosporangium thailandense]NJC71909.1 hypothetical protein [Planosporangium thailandense]